VGPAAIHLAQDAPNVPLAPRRQDLNMTHGSISDIVVWREMFKCSHHVGGQVITCNEVKMTTLSIFVGRWMGVVGKVPEILLWGRRRASSCEVDGALYARQVRVGKVAYIHCIQDLGVLPSHRWTRRVPLDDQP